MSSSAALGRKVTLLLSYSSSRGPADGATEGDAGADLSDLSAAGLPNVSRSLWALFDGFEEWCLGTGSDGRRASVSCTVRMCFARASERVKERSHSAWLRQTVLLLLLSD